MSSVDSINRMIEPTIVDIVTFVNDVTKAAIGKLANLCLEKQTEQEIQLQRRQNGQRRLTGQELSNIKQRFQNLKPLLTEFFSTEAKVFIYNFQTALLISFVASAILFGVNPALVGAFAV